MKIRRLGTAIALTVLLSAAAHASLPTATGTRGLSSRSRRTPGADEGTGTGKADDSPLADAYLVADDSAGANIQC